MEDALKVCTKSLELPESESQSDTTVTNPKPDLPAAPEQSAEAQKSTNKKALDRWFLEQRGNRRVPKRLKLPNELLVTSGGPYKMTGNITLINEDGSVTHANHLHLCRCGASKTRPVCDDQHLEVEFLDNGSVQRVSDCMPITRPQTITVTCVENGPLKFRGYLRIYNKKGQEFITMSGELCRCGKSSNKPFCDRKQGCADA